MTNRLTIGTTGPETLVRRIEAYAKREGLNKSAAIRVLLTKALDADLAERKKAAS